MHLRSLIRTMLSLPKTIYFNFSALPFQKAITLPFFVDYNVKIGGVCQNVFEFDFEPKRFDIKIGKYAEDAVPVVHRGYFSISPNSKVRLHGKAELSTGIIFKTHGNAKIDIGDNFYCNKNCEIISRESIHIGNDVLIGWNVCIRDSDGETHKIISNGVVSQNRKAICILDHVWVCAYAHILKGVTLQPNTVVAYNSCVVKGFNEGNIIIGGVPAVIIKKDIQWER